MSSKSSSYNEELSRLRETSRLIGAELSGVVASLRRELLDATEQLRHEFRNQHQMARTVYSKAAKVETDDQQDGSNETVFEASSKLRDGTKVGNDIATTVALLKSLHFNNMDLRHSKIAEAHHNTCRSAFTSKIARWLRSDDPIFWVSGKPGSGKSTLMKFLADFEETSECLRKWAGNRTLVIVGYYLWINGTEMQRSQIGLLRSVLFDVFRKCPGFIKNTFPDLWNCFSRDNSLAEREDIWTRGELLRGLRNLAQHNASSTAICIFIDGLDEYDGDHEDLLEVIQSFASSSIIKLCVASRPWPVFEEALGKCPKLYLQDLNKPDIELFVKSNPVTRPDFQKLKLLNPEADELIREIVEKSKGVFLWVFLVVRSLRQGLLNSDRFVDLQRRLRTFPSDLNHFFEHILNDLDPIYRPQTARGFLAAMSARDVLSVTNFWNLDVEEANPNFALTLKVSDSYEFREVEERTRVETMTKRINGRYKGLLEVTQTSDNEFPFNHKVDFLHRTVKDFLMTKDAHAILSS